MTVSIIGRALAAGTPLLLATLGEIYCQRAGIMNLGIEGMMAVGAVSAFWASSLTGNPWLGLAAAAGAGVALSLLHAVSTVLFRSNQIVSGLALTMLGLGLSGVFGKSLVGKPLAHRFLPLPLPFLSDLPFIGPSLFSQDPVFYLAVLLWIFLCVHFLYTRHGLRLRAVGDHPLAAETMCVPVIRYKML
ncbi:MAG: ABC transporter permease, partial [Candidatus Wallbacteria bacterium]|nr:ABC transporter permease [Candidatus Wallbacteria bacterium]